MSSLVVPKDLKFIDASEVKDSWGVNILVYGQPGSGKTVFASTAQDSEWGKDVLIVDVEAGTRSIAHRKDIKVFPAKKWEDLADIYLWLREKPHNYRTIVIDSLTEVQDKGLMSVLDGKQAQASEMAGIQDYGKNVAQVTRLLRAFKAFAVERGWNVIFTALEMSDKDELTGVMMRRPALSPKIAQGVAGAVDAIGHLTVNSKNERVMSFAQTASSLGKFRQPNPNAPSVPPAMINPSMVKLLELLHAGQKAPTPAST